MTKDVEKAKVLIVFFASVFSCEICLQQSQLPETCGGAWSNEYLSLVEENQAREYLYNLYLIKSVGPGRIHSSGSWLMSQPGHSQLSLKGQGNLRSFLRTGRNVTFLKKGERKDVGSYRPINVSLISVKVIEQTCEGQEGDWE